MRCSSRCRSRAGTPPHPWAYRSPLLGITLPALATPTLGGGGLIGDLHSNGGNLLLILAGLHGLMALYHHFVLKDDTLRRMSPV